MLTLKIGHARFRVATIAEGSRVWREHRDANGLASSSSPAVSIIEPGAPARTLRVSYNGRVWETGNGAEALVYDPRGADVSAAAP